jgi:addiction module RelE/StbE family toxin
MKLAWAAPALRDLQDIYEYVAQDSVTAADALNSRIYEAAELICRFPYAGRIGRVENSRELSITRTPFVMVYEIQGERIIVLAILRGVRKWPEHFEQD